MNIRLLKAKRIERDIRQSEVAHYHGVVCQAKLSPIDVEI